MRRHVARVTEAEKIAAGRGHSVRTVLDPSQWEESDPFLLLNEDWFPPGTFGDHPHRGFETVTLVLDGTLGHRDNRGNSGTLGPGDAQWMTAGRGIIHSEEPNAGVVHSLQLWLNLPASSKMIEPRYQDLRGEDMPVRTESGATLRVYSGSSGDVKANTLNNVPVTMVEMRLDAGASVSQDLPSDYNAFVYIVEGVGRFGEAETVARAAQAVWLSAGDEITVAATEPLHAILYAGRPLREPVAAYGPFVMNTPEQIRQAFEDFRAGRF